MAEATLPCRALSSELLMKFQWRSRDERLRTKPESQHFFQILADLFSKRRIFRVPMQLADLCSFPCPEAFSGTFKPGSHCAEIQKQVYKAQKPLRRKLLCLSLLQKLSGCFPADPASKAFPPSRGTFLSPNCPLVFGKALKRGHLWSMFSNRMCLCCFAVCVL